MTCAQVIICRSPTTNPTPAEAPEPRRNTRTVNPSRPTADMAHRISKACEHVFLAIVTPVPPSLLTKVHVGLIGQSPLKMYTTSPVKDPASKMPLQVACARLATLPWGGKRWRGTTVGALPAWTVTRATRHVSWMAGAFAILARE